MTQNPICRYHSICDLTMYLPPEACKMQEFISKCPRYLQYDAEFDGKEPLKELERMFREGEIIWGKE